MNLPQRCMADVTHTAMQSDEPSSVLHHRCYVSWLSSLMSLLQCCIIDVTLYRPVLLVLRLNARELFRDWAVIDDDAYFASSFVMFVNLLIAFSRWSSWTTYKQDENKTPNATRGSETPITSYMYVIVDQWNLRYVIILCTMYLSDKSWTISSTLIMFRNESRAQVGLITVNWSSSGSVPRQFQIIS